jgi:hypothetical protein
MRVWLEGEAKNRSVYIQYGNSWGNTSASKSGPVRSFGLESLGPRPRPVFTFYKTVKDRTEPVLTGPARSFPVTEPVPTG